MESFIGQILMVGFNFAPYGYMLCQGQTLAISQYSALYALLGYTFGGDGQTTFKLPDLAGRVPVGFGPSNQSGQFFQMGQAGGSPTTQITVTNLPTMFSTNPSGQSQDAAAFSGSGTAVKVVAPTLMGNGSPINVMQPYVCLNYVMCVNGIFPSRS
jgi:microcystin-dependent protein